MSVCYDSAGIPIPCSGWNVYNSYVTDPRYSRYFTIAWTCTFALLFLVTVPSIFNFVLHRRGGKWQGLFGVYDDPLTRGYEQLNGNDTTPTPPKARLQQRQISHFQKPFLAITALFHSVSCSTLRIPFSHYYSSLSTGHLLWLLLIPLLLLSTLFPESQLAENPNRFGFLALACIPPLFVLSSKNGAISLLLGRSWVAVNFLHRWLGRAILLLVVCHFGLWTVQWARAGELSEFLSSSKERRGIGAFAFLLLITVSSLSQFRRFSYPIFFTLHYVSILGFLVFLNLHTIYARGWATWSVVGIYAVDILGRIASTRIRWVEVEALEEGMTKIKMRGLKGGWVGGQTIDLRLFFLPPTLPRSEEGGLAKKSARRFYESIKAAVRPFESHPFSVATAPPRPNAQAEDRERGIEMYIKSVGRGTWTDDLYRFASSSSTSSSTAYQPLSQISTSPPSPSPRIPTTHALALFFGPYAASSLSTFSAPALFEEKETVSLFAGGSGMSFVLGTLEEIVSRRLGLGKRGQVEVVWVVRELAHLSWFLPRLTTLFASIPSSSPLSLSLQIYVTSASVSSSTLPTLPSNITLHLNTKPPITSILSDQISRLLSPCSHCYPVCRCGEQTIGTNGRDGERNGEAGEGVCPNSEEECVGCCGNAQELLFDTRGGTIRNDDEIQEIGEKEPKSCSSGSGGNREKEEETKTGCCSSKNDKQGGCCSTSYPPGGSDVREVPTPLRARAGSGMSVVVCGPRSMTGELRNAVASVPIAKQVRIGGIDLVVEHYSV
ncbi:hypothetical protein JCM3765_005572 [Sporobolomyces pararoseus]